MEEVKFSPKKVWLFSLLTTGVFLVLLEFCSYFFLANFTNYGTYRFFSPRWIYNPIIGRLSAPNYDVWQSRPDITETEFLTDDKGRSITPKMYDDPDIVVVVTGGSSMFQSSSRNPAMSVPSQLESKIFDLHGIKTEVVNLGVPGYTSFQEAMRLHDYFIAEKADIVVSVSGFNDVTARFDVAKITDPGIYKGEDRKEYDLIFDTRYFNKSDLIRDIENEKFVIFNFVNFLRQRSYFIELLNRIVSRLNTYALERQQAYVRDNQVYEEAQLKLTPEILELKENVAERKARLALSHYAMMDSVAKVNNADYFLILQPSALSWKYFESSTLYKELSPHSKILQPIYKENFNLYMDKVISKNDTITEMHDLRRVLDASEKLGYVDHIHYNDYAAGVLADRILEIIESSFH